MKDIVRSKIKQLWESKHTDDFIISAIIKYYNVTDKEIENELEALKKEEVMAK
jgi:hypothetical protein